MTNRNENFMMLPKAPRLEEEVEHRSGSGIIMMDHTATCV